MTALTLLNQKVKMVKPMINSQSSHANLNFMFIVRLYIPFALGYLISFLFRVVNGMVGGILSTEFLLTKSDLGLMTASYFLTFTLMQIPMGVMLDRIGARKTEGFLLFFAVLGALIFSQATESWHLILGRGLIGFGVCASLMAAFKAYSECFAREKLPMMNNMQMMAGGAGALIGSGPVEILLNYTDWRGVFIILAVATFIIALMILFMPPKFEKPKASNDNQEEFWASFKQYKIIFADKRFWILTPPTVISQASQVAVIFLWGALYLKSVAGFSLHDVGNIMSLAAVCMVLGYVIFGFGSQILPKMGICSTEGLILAGQYIIIFGFAIIVFLPPQFSFWGMFLVVGCMGSGILTYGLLSQVFDIRITGRVNSALNLLAFVMAFIFQWLIGVVIDMVMDWGWILEDAYKLGFAIPMVLLIITIIWQKIMQSTLKPVAGA